MEMTMDDRQMIDDQSELEYELSVIFDDLEEGNMLTASQMNTLRYACGFPKKTRVTPILSEVFDDFSTIFGGK
jgi:hypothetical protein